MAEKFTTIRVYEDDKQVLIERYGGPANEALNKALTECCPHPEASRSYVSASLPMPEQEAITSGSSRRTVAGFYCGACGRYVFKRNQTAELVEPTVA